jgi:hypothetical protein
VKYLHLVVIHKLLHLIEDEFLQGCFTVLSLVHCGHFGFYAHYHPARHACKNCRGANSRQ